MTEARKDFAIVIISIKYSKDFMIKLYHEQRRSLEENCTTMLLRFQCKAHCGAQNHVYQQSSVYHATFLFLLVIYATILLHYLQWFYYCTLVTFL